MNIEILAVGAATPRQAMNQDEALALAHRICCVDERQRRLAGALYKHAGVHTRYTAVPYTEAFRWAPEEPPATDAAAYHGPTTAERMALYQEHALPLAMQAAAEALQQSGCKPREITHIVTASCTGFTAPGVDSGLIHALQLRPTTQRVNVGYMGCHGAINALRVAHGLASTDPRARVLVVAVELCSLHYAFHWDSERMVGNALFGDGAGAVVLGASSEALPVSPTTLTRWRLAATGSYLFPGTSAAMSWQVGDHGFAMTISPQLPTLIRDHLGDWLTAWLAEHNLQPADVRSWAVHPGGPKILDAVESAIGLTRDQTQVSREVLSQFGNMSSATVLFVLKSLLGSGASPPCVMLGFGPGLVAEAALLLPASAPLSPIRRGEGLGVMG